MKIDVVPADRLTPTHVAAWDRIQRAAAALDSPYFRPEFTQAVAAVRQGGEVAVLSQDGQPVGFWPFFREGGRVAYPIADTLTDFQGVIAEPGVAWQPARLLSDCGLSAFYFDRLVTAQQPFNAYHWQRADSPSMDLSGGFDSYRRRRENPRSKLFRKTQQKYRKLEREVGPVRFEPRSTDTAAFGRLIEWKSDQYRRTQTGDVLKRGWTVDLLEHVLRQQHDDFSGMQSVLYAGDDVAAVQVGMRSRGVLHYWFIAHNPAYAQYSPGALLLVSVAQAAATLGIQRIDLGKGDEAFKARYMTGATSVANGAVDLRPLLRPVRRFWLRAQDWVLRSRWQTPARFLVRKTRTVLGRGTA